MRKKGKAGGGYCTYIENYKAPFIFSNFNGTSGDIDVLTHEAGHAFQVYESRKFEIPEYNWPTYEACEIHSMSMEFFTWPWMKLFFEEDADKYYFSHLSSALLFYRMVYLLMNINIMYMKILKRHQKSVRQHGVI